MWAAKICDRADLEGMIMSQVPLCLIRDSRCVLLIQPAAMSLLHAEPPPGQLPTLAAAHPQAYTALIDCCLRIPGMSHFSMLLPGRLLLYASPAMLLGSQAALDHPAAVAGLASALTSLSKLVVQRISKAADLQSQPAAAATDATAAYFPAAAPNIAIDCVGDPARTLIGWFEGLDSAAAGNVGGSSSSSSSSQAAASAALLAVVFARSFVQLADVMNAAGPRVFLRSVLGRPVFAMRWLNEPGGHGCNFATQQMQKLWAAFKSVGIAPLAAAAGDSAAAAAAASASAASTSDSSGSSASQQVKWGYLLRLQQCSPQWAAAVAAYEANQPIWQEIQDMALPSSAAAAAQLSQQYADAIGLCKALAAAAPLPILCNNPSCGNTEGVSEAAAASKRCSGCKCRYCSAACQKADWKRHKEACKRMAAARQACV
jgi:hypothetical protein